MGVQLTQLRDFDKTLLTLGWSPGCKDEGELALPQGVPELVGKLGKKTDCGLSPRGQAPAASCPTTTPRKAHQISPGFSHTSQGQGRTQRVLGPPMY
jgi:hypothetical protein